MDTEGWIELLKEKIQGVRDQLNRLISHFESEQRTQTRHGSDIDRLMHRMDTMEKELARKENDWKFWISIGVGIIAALIAWFKN